MLNGMKSRLLSGKMILLIIMGMLILFSCSKKETTIAWEKNATFAEILDSTGDDYVMIDFIRDD